MPGRHGSFAEAPWGVSDDCSLFSKEWFRRRRAGVTKVVKTLITGAGGVSEPIAPATPQ